VPWKNRTGPPKFFISLCAKLFLQLLAISKSNCAQQDTVWYIILWCGVMSRRQLPSSALYSLSRTKIYLLQFVSSNASSTAQYKPVRTGYADWRVSRRGRNMSEVYKRLESKTRVCLIKLFASWRKRMLFCVLKMMMSIYLMAEQSDKLGAVEGMHWIFLIWTSAKLLRISMLTVRTIHATLTSFTRQYNPITRMLTSQNDLNSYTEHK